MLDGTSDPGLGGGSIQCGATYLGHLCGHIHRGLVLDADAILLVLQAERFAEHVDVGLEAIMSFTGKASKATRMIYFHELESKHDGFC